MEGSLLIASVLGLAVITAACLLFNWFCSKIKMPAILGWIIAGVVVGNLPFTFVHEIKESEFLNIAGELGVIFLMFKSGLEAKPDSIKKNLVGGGAVALLGVLFVGICGYGVARLMLPEGSHWLGYVYVAAALTPTSAGIPAAIFGAKKQASSNEGITVMVAAILDDVLGLVIMALLGALATTVQSGGPIEVIPLLIEAAKGLGFVGVGFWLGVWVLPKHLSGALKLPPEFVLPAAVAVCLLIAFIGSAFFGLAPLIGGYVAGLVFEAVRVKDHGHSVELEKEVEPLVGILAPVFFFYVGTKVPFEAFTNIQVLLLAAALIGATLVGKIFSGIGVVGGARRAPVVAGMMPRGEVASIMVKNGSTIMVGGAALISTEVFTAFVLMIAGTTILAILGLNKFLEPNKPL